MECPECGSDKLTQPEPFWSRSFDTVSIDDLYRCMRCDCQFEVTTNYVKRGGVYISINYHGLKWEDEHGITWEDEQ